MKGKKPMEKITICKMSNPSEYLPQIDTNEAEAGFINAVSENNENIYSMLDIGYESISLYCVVGNDRARHLYDELGFKQVYCNEYAKKKIS